jgi:hypothetical protein
MSWAVISIATTVTSLAVSEQRAGKVADAQDKQAATERAIASEKGSRERRVQRAKAQTASAEISNTAASTGQTASSAAIAGGQSIASQAAGNIAEINTSMAEANILTGARQKVAKAGRIGLGEALVGQAGNIAAGAIGTQIGKKLGGG